MTTSASVLTFLFTDIEGSTRRWEADAGAMRIELAAHDEVLRAAITDSGGEVFKHTGDGMCAVFSSPGAAVGAAVAAQRALDLPVRMGVATGEAEQREGDYFGTVLNRVSRVMSAGHGGQILLDGQTAGLLAGVELTAFGARRLRDIAQAVELFQVRAEGLRADFPPLKTADPAPGNLRPTATSLVGRDADVIDVLNVLRVHRLVTLTGVGGVGKTRLALETAARACVDFTDGGWLIELGPIGDPSAVPAAVAATLGITQQPGLSATASIASALAGRSRLLVFDNCEHVIDAAAEVIDSILAGSATVTILVTSREGLRLNEELLWPVPSLDVGAGIDSPAARLFVERAGAASRGLSAAAQDAAVEICRRLDGIPLAIELAASRLVSMTAAEVRDRLDDRFRLLVGSRRGLERHQTLRHAVQWSFDLLDDGEKDLLARCSVFAGGFDLEAAVAITGVGDDLATLDLLDALVRKSLLAADRSSARTRYSMLETIRQFAEEQLVAVGVADHVRAAHARYFAGLEAVIFDMWASVRQCETHSWLATELANLRAAFRFAADRGDLDSAAAIAHYAAFVGFWGDQHEPIQWAEELIEPARRVHHRRLGQLYAAAQLCYAAGRLENAREYAAAGQSAAVSGEFDEIHAEVEASLNSSAVWMGEPGRWVEWCRDVIARRSADTLHARGCLALALKFSGEDEQALAASEGFPTAASAIATRNPNLAAWTLFAYGMAQRDTNPTGAYEALRKGLEIARISGGRMAESSIAATLSSLATAHGEATDALDYLTLSIRYYYDSGSFYLVPSPLAFLVVLFNGLGRHEAAATIFGLADQPFTRASFPELTTTMAHLRDILGAKLYESLARTGEHMTTAEMVSYAFEQIDHARAELT